MTGTPGQEIDIKKATREKRTYLLRGVAGLATVVAGAVGRAVVGAVAGCPISIKHPFTLAHEREEVSRWIWQWQGAVRERSVRTANYGP